MPMTKDDLIARHLSKETVTCMKDGVMYFCMEILRVAARRMDDGTIKIQADVWSGVWDEPMITVDLEDVVCDKASPTFRPRLSELQNDGKHWLTEAMEQQTPVWINGYGCADIRGYRVVGVTIDRWPDGRFAIGAECRTDACPHSTTAAAVWQVKIDREGEDYGRAGTPDGAEGSGTDLARVAS